MKANRTIGAAVVLSVLLMAATAQAFTTWDGGGDGTSWNSPDNWNPNGVPSGGDEVRLTNGGSNVSVVIAENEGNAYLRVGYGATGTATALITQTAGAVNFSSFITMANCGTYNLQGGTMSTPDLYLQFDGGDRPLPSRGTVEVSGGVLTVGNLKWMGYGRNQGRLVIDGGAGIINVGTFEAGATNDLLSLRPNGNNLSPVNVSGSAALGQELDVVFSADPTPGTVFTVINKASAGPVTGTFIGLAQDAVLSVPRVVGGGSWDLKVSYAGGDGNDVTLTVASAGIPNMTASPAGPLDLGSLGVSTASTVTTVTLSSNGDPGTTVKITDASVAGAGFGFSSIPGATPVSVLAGDNAQYGIQLAAQPVPGHYTGTATFVTDIPEGAGFKTFTYALAADVIAHDGDVNGDGQVSLLDYNIIKVNFGNVYESGTHWADGDVNGDGQVGLLDFNIVKAHFGHTTGDSPLTAVPEPATLALLALAGLAALRRRR